MSILDTLKKVKEDGFDPKKDSVNKSGLLEPGNYPVRLKSAERSATKAGHEQVVVTLEVVSGDEKDRTELIFLGFQDTLPEFVLEKNGRILMKLAEFAGVTFTNKDLADEEATAEALSRGIGNQLLLKLTTSPNKNNPDRPYRNYDFDSLDSNPFDTGGEVDIPEDDLPF